MNIDKETIPTYLNVVMEDSASFIEQLRKQADEDGQNESLDADEKKKLSLTLDTGAFDMEEYYFDSSDSEIVFSGNIVSSVGKTWVSFNIPLSDMVLIDILEHSVKRLNKLKTVLETLK